MKQNSSTLPRSPSTAVDREVDREELRFGGDAKPMVIALGAIALAVSAWGVDAASRGAAEPPAVPVRLRIELNRASVEELMLLPGIGPELASRIVEHRETVGPFRSLAALDEVHGVGEAKLESVTPYLTVAEEPETQSPFAPRK